jgi:hypothetical protein
MNPVTPARPAAVPAATIERALTEAARDPDRIAGLLDELSRALLWVPLPEDEAPVTDGSAVVLPIVTYLGAEFVPAFVSAGRLADWHGGGEDVVPHIVVPAAELARRLPEGVGIALNPGAEASVPIYPEGVGLLADKVHVGHPPADPVVLLSEVRTVLRGIPEVRQASRAWLSVPGQGEGLVISVTLDDPASEAAHKEVITAIEQAADAVPQQGFPIDVTFPGEGEPDQLDEWIAAHANPFYTADLRY